MPSPFPGMDPYLEGRGVFHDFHNSLCAQIHGALNLGLPPRYYATLDSRQEIGISDEPPSREMKADVGVNYDPSRTGSGTLAVMESTAIDKQISPSVDFEIEIEPLEPTFVEIRDAQSEHELITVIEVLSPSNKLPGRDRVQYLAKREAILSSRASLIEIDLLRMGERVWNEPDYRDALINFYPPPEYLVAINRSWRRSSEARRAYQLFLIGLRSMLPVIPIPLRQGEVEPVLDLQEQFFHTYNRGPYQRGVVKYLAPPPAPAFAPEDYEWVVQQTQKLLPR